MGIAIAIVAVVAFAIVGLLVTARSRATTGRLSRETRKRDDAAGASAVAAGAGPDDEAAGSTASGVEGAGEGRSRADEARKAIESGGSTVPATAASSTPVVYEPIDPDELGVTRRQFFNRSILAGSGLGLGAFGVAALAFLWPSAGAGFGGKIVVGSVADAKSAFDNKIPFYNAAAKTYIVAYPSADLPKAKKIAAYTAPIIAGMEQGYVALYQKCVHLGCRVPWCPSSQWFECPCHGSKYNRVGEKQGGPAPRGLDRFALDALGRQHRRRHRPARHRPAHRHEHDRPEPRRGALCVRVPSCPAVSVRPPPEHPAHEFPHHPDPRQPARHRGPGRVHRLPGLQPAAEPRGEEPGQPHPVLRRRGARGCAPRAGARRVADRARHRGARAARLLHLGAVPCRRGQDQLQGALDRARCGALRQLGHAGVRQHQVAPLRELPRHRRRRWRGRLRGQERGPPL